MRFSRFGSGQVAEQHLYLGLQPIQRRTDDHDKTPAQCTSGTASKHDEANDAQQAKDYGLVDEIIFKKEPTT